MRQMINCIILVEAKIIDDYKVYFLQGLLTGFQGNMKKKFQKFSECLAQNKSSSYVSIIEPSLSSFLRSLKKSALKSMILILTLLDFFKKQSHWFVITSYQKALFKKLYCYNLHVFNQSLLQIFQTKDQIQCGFQSELKSSKQNSFSTC